MTAKRRLRHKLNVLGKSAGQVLVDWLNGEGTYKGNERTPAHSRIEALLKEWHSLASFPVNHWQSEDWDRFEELQRKLSRYRMSPQIDQKRMGGLGMRFTWNPGTSEEAKAVLVITWLGERALLWRIRRCGQRDLSTLLAELGHKKPGSCGKWFYARRKDQKFCGSLQCRQRVYASKAKTPAVRAKRKLYMRNYRAVRRKLDQGFHAKFGNQKPNLTKTMTARGKANDERHTD